MAKDVWFVQGEAALGSSANRNFISNAGFVVTEEGVVVVDALGSPPLAEELIKEIHRVTAQPVKFVIMTHYHADHVYGLQAFKAVGATVLAHAEGREYLNSDTARLRLEASRKDLFPWVDEKTRLVPADRWLDREETTLKLGSFEFLIRHVGAAHTPEDVVVYVAKRGVLFAGDLVFRGRIPFVGQADSRQWIDSLGRLITFKPRIMIPGHGPVSTEPVQDLELTRDYLIYLRRSMKDAATNLEPFEDAYNTYLLMEQQGPK